MRSLIKHEEQCSNDILDYYSLYTATYIVSFRACLTLALIYLAINYPKNKSFEPLKDRFIYNNPTYIKKGSERYDKENISRHSTVCTINRMRNDRTYGL